MRSAPARACVESDLFPARAGLCRPLAEVKMDRSTAPWLLGQSSRRAACAAHAFAALAALVALLPVSSQAAAEPPAATVAVEALIAEALAHNPEIIAARHEQEAAAQRAGAAGALEDPTLEFGVVNAPLPVSLRRDDMTMKMLGLTQKLPYPGKRGLREAVAAADSASVSHAVEETANRVQRDLRIAYEELRLARSAERIAAGNRELLRQLVAVTEAQYALGRGAQSDVLRAQSEVVRMQQELLRIGSDEVARTGALERLLGRAAPEGAIVPTAATLLPLPADIETLTRRAADQRPQLRALDALVERSDREIELARREYYPDFELRLAYGQRDRTLGGTPRDDMITMTVAVNLPIWRQGRLEPRVAQARATRAQASAVADAQRLETRTGLAQQLAVERAMRESAVVYRSTLLPQVHAAAESALRAYQLGRVDFLTLLDAHAREYATALAEADALAAHNKAIAEIDFLTGATAGGALP
jgi:outer membrane protein, heavy metal efflux system